MKKQLKASMIFVSALAVGHAQDGADASKAFRDISPEALSTAPIVPDDFAFVAQPSISHSVGQEDTRIERRQNPFSAEIVPPPITSGERAEPPLEPRLESSPFEPSSLELNPQPLSPFALPNGLRAVGGANSWEPNVPEALGEAKNVASDPAPKVFQFLSGQIYHPQLHFEQPMLERHGATKSQLFQPVVSAGHFLKSSVFYPWNVVRRHRRAETSTGWGTPGSRVSAPRASY